MISRTLVLIIFASLFSCSSNGDHSMSKDSYSMETNEGMAMVDAVEEQFQSPTTNTQAPHPPPSNGDKKQEATPLILLREGHCRLEVDNLDRELNRIQFLVNSYNGYVSDLNIQNNGWQKEATFLLRIPAKHFQNTIDSIKFHAEKIVYQRISTQDVTEEYVDISSRLETKKQVRDRYVEILRNKAKTVEEILMAEEKIRHLQEEIEAREGRLRYLKNRASMSTITIELFEELEQIEKEEEEDSWLVSFIKDAGESLGIGGHIVRGIVLGALAIWPILLIIGLLIWRRKSIRAKLFKPKS